jgi:flagellar biosynthetic protein FliO
MTGITAQSWLAVLIVLALVGALAYLVRKGALGTLGRKGSSIQVETAAPLGERRSLVIVSVEGRRLLLGLTPSQVSLVAELSAAGPGLTQTFERHLDQQS